MDASAIPGDNVIARLAGVQPGSTVAAALAGRADILAMTRESEQASLSPREPGGLSHGERAALAVRIARLHGEADLAAHYGDRLARAGATGASAALAEPAFKGGGDKRLAALLAYTDLVSVSPKDTAAGDIEDLKVAGIGDADIVRLAELTAFLAYQVRVVQGLKLMQATA